MGSLIQWPKAKYWTQQFNPWIGCRPYSPACENCYAAAMTKRFGGSFDPHRSKQTKPPAKGVCFCGNMTDCFGGWVERDEAGEWIASCIKNYNKPVTYLWLTKRPNRMADAVHYVSDRLHMPEVWFANNYFGITAENQEFWRKRRNRLDLPQRAKWWASLEPLLGPIDMELTFQHPFTGAFRVIPEREFPSWVVVGCESGPHRRPCKIEWVESIVQQCMNAKIPVFVKQLDINGRCETDINKFPNHLRIRQVPWKTRKEEKS